MNERSTIVSGISAASEGSAARPEVDEYPLPSSGTQLMLHYVLLAIVGIMAIITFILGLVQAVKVDAYGGTYFMIALMHLLLVFVESFLIFFVRNGVLEGGTNKVRSFYILGGMTLLHSLFTDIALFKY